MSLREYLSTAANPAERREQENNQILKLARSYASKANPDANAALDVNAIQGYSIAKKSGLVPHIKGLDL